MGVFSVFSSDNDNNNTLCKLSIDSSWGTAKPFIEEAISRVGMDKCIEGFLMVVNKVGQLLFVTPGVAESVGFTQVFMFEV